MVEVGTYLSIHEAIFLIQNMYLLLQKHHIVLFIHYLTIYVHDTYAGHVLYLQRAAALLLKYMSGTCALVIKPLLLYILHHFCIKYIYVLVYMQNRQCRQAYSGILSSYFSRTYESIIMSHSQQVWQITFYLLEF